MKKMKFIVLLATTCSLMAGCATPKNESVEQEEIAVIEETTASDETQFGVAVDQNLAVAVSELTEKLEGSDEVEVTLKGKVVEVCQKKGCWMSIAREGQDPLMVRFKDYALFMPKDIAGKEVVIHGVANKELVSVDDLRHYAEDAGKTAEEIAAITEAKMDVSFLADGVNIL